MLVSDHPSSPDRLKCEYRQNPLGITEWRPRLSWQVRDVRRGAVQSAYRIMVASTRQALRQRRPDIWDSGKISSDQSLHVEYDGQELISRKRYFWKVRTWDVSDQPSAWSRAEYWEMGLGETDDWSAEWIGMSDEADSKPSPVAYLRKELEIGQSIKRARLYVTALGVYDVQINGSKVGDELLAPGWTDYTKRVLYRSHDVTNQIKAGANAIGVRLGAGWYTGPLTWTNDRNVFGEPPSKLFLQLEIEMANGSTVRVVSDDSWKSSRGPIVHSELYEGERYDAGLEMDGWDRSGFDDSTWGQADLFDRPGIAVDSDGCPPIRVTQELRPVTFSEPAPGVYIADFGQNMVGVCRLRVHAKEGTEIRLRFAEVLDWEGSGNIYTDNLRGAACTDYYVAKGNGLETYVPTFTYHGFRYVEITGLETPPDVTTLTGLVFHTDMPQTGSITTSSEVVNRTFENLMWGFRGNHHSAPTDCPQRDERMGWTGDAQIFCRTACYTNDMSGFYAKYINDMADAQTPEGYFSDVAPHCYDIDRLGQAGAPGWADAGVIVPWTYYLTYGDKRILTRNYENMACFVDAVASENPDGLWRSGRHSDFGDWVPAGDDSDKDMFSTLYSYYSASLMAQISHILGKDARATQYKRLSEKIGTAFNAAYLKNGIYANATQTLNSMALWLDIVPEKSVKSVANALVDNVREAGYHLATGFHGTRFLVQALSKSGHHDVACRLAVNRDYPSWGYQISKGATTVWERWNGDEGDPEMNSYNHYAFGSVGEWMFKYLAGIDADSSDPAYHHILISPGAADPKGELTSVTARFESMYGTIVSAWESTPTAFTLELEVPANSRATVALPGHSIDQLTESGQPLHEVEGVARVRIDGDRIVCDVGAGKFFFSCRTV